MVTLATHRPAAQQIASMIGQQQQQQPAPTRQAIDPPSTGHAHAEGRPPSSAGRPSVPQSGDTKRPTLVLPPAASGASRSLLTPTLMTGEANATPSHLFSSLVQLNGQEIGLFTGLPSCTPTSADSLVGRNPFFLGVSSFNGQANPIATYNRTNIQEDTNQQQQQPPQQQPQQQHQQLPESQQNIYPSLDEQQQHLLQQYENSKPNGYQQVRKRPISGLSMDQIHQTANTMILQPLNFFLSPQQESWLRFGLQGNQHPLAGVAHHQHNGVHPMNQSNHNLETAPMQGQTVAANGDTGPQITAQDLSSTYSQPASSNFAARAQQAQGPQAQSSDQQQQATGAPLPGNAQLPRLAPPPFGMECGMHPMNLGHQKPATPLQQTYISHQRHPLYSFHQSPAQLTMIGLGSQSVAGAESSAESRCRPNLKPQSIAGHMDIAQLPESSTIHSTVSNSYSGFSDSSQTGGQLVDISRLTSKTSSPSSISCDTVSQSAVNSQTIESPTAETRTESYRQSAASVAAKSIVPLKRSDLEPTTESLGEPVRKKSKGGRKKKIVSHEEMIAKKNRSKERNRVAAKRCRQKRKKFVDELRSRIDNLNEMNDKLIRESILLKSELEQLRQHHKTCAL